MKDLKGEKQLLTNGENLFKHDIQAKDWRGRVCEGENNLKPKKPENQTHKKILAIILARMII